MTKKVLSIIVLLQVLYFKPSCHGQTKQMTKQDWLTDLDYLSNQLPKKHANLFHTLSRSEFEKVVTQLRNKIHTLTDNEIKLEFIKLAAMAKDGHTDVAINSQRYPIRLSYFGDTLYVVAAIEANTDIIGGVVRKVSDTDIAKAREMLIPLVDGDNEMEIPRKVPDFLTMAEILHGVHLTPDAERVTYTIYTETGAEKKVTLTPVNEGDPTKYISARAKSKSAIPLYLQKIEKNYWFTHLQDQRTIYVQYNLCHDQKGEPSIDAFSRELFRYTDAYDFDFFILDIRHNPGGNFKKSAPLVEGIRKRASINKKGKLFIVTSRNTGSAATVTGAQLKVSTQATIVGELSRCNPNFTYNAERFTLPNSKLSVGYTESLHHPFPELGTSLSVDIPVTNTFSDLKNGKDRILDLIWKNYSSR